MVTLVTISGDNIFKLTVDFVCAIKMTHGKMMSVLWVRIKQYINLQRGKMLHVKIMPVCCQSNTQYLNK